MIIRVDDEISIDKKNKDKSIEILTLLKGITPLNMNIAYPAATPIRYGSTRVHGAM